MSASSSEFISTPFKVNSPDVTYFDERIESKYKYRSSYVDIDKKVVTPMEQTFLFQTQTKIPKVGVMLVGWGGNNGSTLTAGILANKHKLTWTTKEGKHVSDYFGSLTQASTLRLGLDNHGQSVYIPFKSILPMVDPNNLVLTGWDISSLNLADSMARAQVLDYDLQRQLTPLMSVLKPLPSIHNSDFIASNQSERADNLVHGTKQEQLEHIRHDIRTFKAQHQLDKVILLWTANTERFSRVEVGLNSTWDELKSSILRNEDEISPSTIFAVASVLEGCSYINGSPQNTCVPGVVELAQNQDVFIVGDDFKSGQTKMKSVLVDFLVSAGLKPTSIVSYNHLGNNDGRNLSAPEQFRSKEFSKSNVVDDMVNSNRILYQEGETPDHCVVIKYVPHVGDSKRAMDEYTSDIFMGGKNTIVMHNTCEDSLLATPLMIDLIVLCELCERITVAQVTESNTLESHTDTLKFTRLHSVLSLLSYLLKAPLVPTGMPVINALNAQRMALVNVFRACVGLPAEDFMLLEHRIPSLVDLCVAGNLFTATQNSSQVKSCTHNGNTPTRNLIVNKVGLGLGDNCAKDRTSDDVVRNECGLSVAANKRAKL